MKQEITDTTSQSNIQEKNSKIEVLNIRYFYDLFVNKRESKKNLPTFLIFKKIIKTYLKIYFTELYMNRSPKYFFLGGKMKIVTYPSWVSFQKRGYSDKAELHRSNKAIGLFWYDKATPKIHFMVKLVKLTGSTNMIPKIEALFTRNNDKDLLPIFTEEQKKGRLNKTLYRCIQT